MIARRFRSLVTALVCVVVGAGWTGAQQGVSASAGYVTTSDGARLFYRLVGRGTDTLIAIHGGPGVDLESIAGDFVPLTEKHVVIYYDQRGAGRSTLPRDTMTLNVAQQVLDLDAIRTHFKLERITLVAHSYGAFLAATYAVAPASDPRGIRYGLTTTNRIVMASHGDWDLREGLKNVKAPTLVVHGEAEAIPMDLVEEWATSLPNAKLVKIPRAAHFAYAERPELVWPEVERFLAAMRK